MSRGLVLALAFAATSGAALAQGNPSFNVINKSGQPIRELFATPAGDANYGRSRLNGRPIAPGAAQVIRLPPGINCIYDIRITYADGHNEDHRALNTCRGTDVIAGSDNTVAGGAPAGGAPREVAFRLFNAGAMPVTELFAVPSGAPHRGGNILEGVIAPGAAQMIHLPPGGGCDYDLHVVFADRASRDKKNADLCKITDMPVR